MSRPITLRGALKDLLDDTEHKDHDCGDVNCPVARARAALASTPEPALDVTRLERSLRRTVSSLPEQHGGFGLVRATEVNDAISAVIAAITSEPRAAAPQEGDEG